ncbi:MAG: biofilm PGA synthesis N-glycosyltransferase PgaC [Salibacteraceae bacterium]|jgi:cellulose synthase/poly-beta-1,6-N-acetylglucosamine synthase-like glycosyltransferase
MVLFATITVVVLLWYSIIILRFLSGIEKNKNVIIEKIQSPSITVVVALKNEAANVHSLISNLGLIDYPKDKLEFILVDDNSIDSTLSELTKYSLNNTQVFSNSGNGKKKAIEMGVEYAKGDWIAVTDADCELPNSWLSSMVGYISNETKMVLGPVFVSHGNGFLTDIQTIEFLALQGATSGSAGRNTPISANGANMFFEKKAFQTVNPYENNYHLKTGDDQFLMMAIKNKYQNAIVYAQDKNAIVITQPVNSWNKYIAQRVRWASKGSAYSDTSIKLKGAVIFMTSLLVASSLIYGITIGNYYLAFGFILVKMLVDLVLIVPMKRFSGRSFSLLSLIGSAILYPFVVVVSVGLGQLKNGNKNS